MTLQISEIGIRLAVGEPASQPAAEGERPQGDRGAALSPQQTDELVRRCVQEVLAALRALGER